ncbi:MAG: MarR family transcriptional regulator [Reyranella sp.]|nr:MarR family transcriptional regulator [Reyranella sp.]
MITSSFSAVLRLLGANARLEERFSNGLGSLHGLALKEVLLLMHLERAPRRRLSRIDLAKRLYVSPSTVTRMAAPLEKLGVVSREADPRDARLAYVVLTEAGQELVANARASLEVMATDIFRDRWTSDDIATLAELLGRLTSGQPSDLG